MVQDKYLGLAFAVTSSFAIGTSFIIQKKGLNDAAKYDGNKAASESLSYLRNPIWWAGISAFLVGEVANFAAYTMAPPILVTPLGALSVIIGAILASFILDEELGHLGRTGCALCLLGSLIIVLHAPDEKDVETVDEMLRYAIQPGFLLFAFIVFVSILVLIHGVVPKYGRTTPIVYVSICSLAGSILVMAIKGFGVAVKLTIEGDNQFTHPSTYLFSAVVTLCGVVQMNYFNKALDTFSTNIVTPMYYVGFTTSTIVASVILYQGFETTSGTDAVSVLTGFVITFLGVHLVNLSREPEAHGSAPRSHGFVQPRLSIDGWGVQDTGSQHRRRSSVRRLQNARLFTALEGHLEDAMGEGLGLSELREVDEDTDDEESARYATTHRKKASWQHHRATGSSPREPTSAQSVV